VRWTSTTTHSEERQPFSRKEWISFSVTLVTNYIRVWQILINVSIFLYWSYLRHSYIATSPRKKPKAAAVGQANNPPEVSDTGTEGQETKK
jgi:hypothetical protein